MAILITKHENFNTAQEHCMTKKIPTHRPENKKKKMHMFLNKKSSPLRSSHIRNDYPLVIYRTIENIKRNSKKTAGNTVCNDDDHETGSSKQHKSIQSHKILQIKRRRKNKKARRSDHLTNVTIIRWYSIDLTSATHIK